MLMAVVPDDSWASWVDTAAQLMAGGTHEDALGTCVAHWAWLLWGTSVSCVCPMPPVHTHLYTRVHKCPSLHVRVGLLHVSVLVCT